MEPVRIPEVKVASEVRVTTRVVPMEMVSPAWGVVPAQRIQVAGELKLPLALAEQEFAGRREGKASRRSSVSSKTRFPVEIPACMICFILPGTGSVGRSRLS